MSPDDRMEIEDNAREVETLEDPALMDTLLDARKAARVLDLLTQTPSTIAVANLQLGDIIRLTSKPGVVTALATCLTGSSVMGYDLNPLYAMVQVNGTWLALWPHDTVPIWGTMPSE